MMWALTPVFLVDHATSLLVDLRQAFVGYARWFWRDVTLRTPHSYFWWLVCLTVLVLALERVRPWREQTRTRAESARGVAYAFLNFFGFGLLGYAALSDTFAARVTSWFAVHGMSPLNLVDPSALPLAAELALYLVTRDFIEYWIHRLLHRVPALWSVHQVHHSVQRMQVFAHLQYHPLETVVYRTLEFVPMWALGFSLRDFFFAHVFALAIGHMNHANVSVPMGWLRFVFNSAEMHILHHGKVIPSGARARGVNFGLTLSVWDYVFGTAYCPDAPRRDTVLGFDDIETYPTTLTGQLAAPFEKAQAGSGDTRDAS